MDDLLIKIIPSLLIFFLGLFVAVLSWLVKRYIDNLDKQIIELVKRINLHEAKLDEKLLLQDKTNLSYALSIKENSIEINHLKRNFSHKDRP